MESPAFQTRIMALGQYLSHVFLQDLQILQQRTLLTPSFRSLPIAIDPIPGSLPVVMLPAPEGAANIPSSGIPGYHKKEDLAMSAAHHVSLPFGLSFQQGVPFETNLLDDRLGAILLAPIRPKGKNPPEGD